MEYHQITWWKVITSNHIIGGNAQPPTTECVPDRSESSWIMYGRRGEHTAAAPLGAELSVSELPSGISYR